MVEEATLIDVSVEEWNFCRFYFKHSAASSAYSKLSDGLSNMLTFSFGYFEAYSLSTQAVIVALLPPSALEQLCPWSLCPVM
jgi:hypothetical protein